MGNVKNAKFICSINVNSKFGEGVILAPIKFLNDQGGGCTNNCLLACGCISSGCGSSNKIKVYR